MYVYVFFNMHTYRDISPCLHHPRWKSHHALGKICKTFSHCQVSHIILFQGMHAKPMVVEFFSGSITVTHGSINPLYYICIATYVRMYVGTVSFLLLL